MKEVNDLVNDEAQQRDVASICQQQDDWAGRQERGGKVLEMEAPSSWAEVACAKALWWLMMPVQFSTYAVGFVAGYAFSCLLTGFRNGRGEDDDGE
jgi:hypothetical protein